MIGEPNIPGPNVPIQTPAGVNVVWYETLRAALKAILTGPTAKSYTVASAPSAANRSGTMIFVTDEAGGSVLAFSDGTNWRRCTDRQIISA